MNKKGNAIADTLLVLVFLVILGLSIFFFYRALNPIYDNIQSDPTFDAESKALADSIGSRLPALWDNLFLMAFLLLWGVTIVASFNIDTHPIFFSFSLVLMIFVFWLSMILGNAAETIMIDGEMVATVALFPKANWILTHLLTVAIVVGSSILLVLFGKNQQ